MVPLRLITRLHNIVDSALKKSNFKCRNDVYVRNDRIYSELEEIPDTRDFRKNLENAADREGFRVVKYEKNIVYFDLD